MYFTTGQIMIMMCVCVSKMVSVSSVEVVCLCAGSRPVYTKMSYDCKISLPYNQCSVLKKYFVKVKIGEQNQFNFLKEGRHTAVNEMLHINFKQAKSLFALHSGTSIFHTGTRYEI